VKTKFDCVFIGFIDYSGCYPDYRYNSRQAGKAVVKNMFTGEHYTGE